MSTHLSSISNTFFTNLLNRLGVRPPPPEGFDLINLVQPVTLVDSDIVLPVSSSSILLDLPFTAGYTVNPAAAAILADTGPQPFGTYQLDINLGVDGLGAQQVALEIVRRNAANAADIWAILVDLAQSNYGAYRWTGRITLQANERIVVRNKILQAGGTAISANIWITT